MSPMPTSGQRSHQRSAAVLLRMSPEFLERIDAAASAAQRTRIRYLLELLDSAIPTPLDLGPQDVQEARVAS
jgi:hypothetical protein